MTRETWIEVALNGPWGQRRQPRIPITVGDIVEQAVACASAGAAIVHFHAYDETSGMQRDDWHVYARIIEKIRSRAGVIAYPTIPLAGSSLTGQADSARARYRHMDELGARGLIEWAVVDPGSVNFRRVDAEQRGEAGFVYLNPDEHVEEGLRVCAEHGLHPSFAIYEPGFARLGSLLAAKHRNLPCPIYRLMFSDEFAWGFPPAAYALDAYKALLNDVAPSSPWMVAGLGVDVRPLVQRSVQVGGHVRVGLEDAHFGCERSNVALVEEAVRLVASSGGQAATPEAVRRALSAVTGSAGAVPARP
ncbi:MAG: 3-keto-5-aminohexanoate cleavage protein [Acetobacteraceae bacterium]|nr:3-keto-5-aminohexanoate cleavage protein [Acetobacteraceae bacterium]